MTTPTAKTKLELADALEKLGPQGHGRIVLALELSDRDLIVTALRRESLWCDGADRTPAPSVAGEVREAIAFQFYRFLYYANCWDWPHDQMWENFQRCRGSVIWERCMRSADALAALMSSRQSGAGVDADQIWNALKNQCAATKDKSEVKTLVTVRRSDVIAACAALTPSRQSSAGEAEPVAWLYETWIGEDSWSQKFTDTKPAGNKWERNIRPLYLAAPLSTTDTAEGR